MPLPKRRRRESERKFMGRCMGWMHRSGEAERRYPAEGQPAAVCYSQFRRRNGDVTFGRMDRSDPSEPVMSIMNDGIEVGYITAETVPDETTRIVTYVQSRVSGYMVNLFGDAGEDKYFEIEDGENPRSALARAKRWAREKLGPRANPSFVPWTRTNPRDEIKNSLAWAREQIRLCRCDPRNPCLACVRAETEIREAAARRNPPLEDKALELAAKLAANARLDPRFMGQIAIDLEAILAGTADADTARPYANMSDEVIEEASQLLMRLAYGIAGDKPGQVKARAQEIIAELDAEDDARENPGSPPLGGNAEFYRERWERERDPEWGLRYAHALDREGSYERAREVYDELAGVYEQAGSRGMRAITRTRAGELARRRNDRRYYR